MGVMFSALDIEDGRRYYTSHNEFEAEDTKELVEALIRVNPAHSERQTKAKALLALYVLEHQDVSDETKALANKCAAKIRGYTYSDQKLWLRFLARLEVMCVEYGFHCKTRKTKDVHRVLGQIVMLCDVFIDMSHKISRRDRNTMIVRLLEMQGYWDSSTSNWEIIQNKLRETVEKLRSTPTKKKSASSHPQEKFFN